MSSSFKVIHIRDALATYDKYVTMGKPSCGHAFEMIMAQYIIDRVNNKVMEGRQTISLNEEEFKSYRQIIHQSNTQLNHIK